MHQRVGAPTLLRAPACCRTTTIRWGRLLYQAVAKILVLSCDLGLASCSMSFAPAIIVERVPPQLPAAAHYGAY